MRLRFFSPAAVLLTIGAGAGKSEPLACRGAEQPREVAELFFGRRTGSRVVVGEAAWQRFVAREITPRFPDGLTIVSANGQWRDATGRMNREPTTLVIIAMPGNAEDHERLGEIANAYKIRFRQHSVGIIVRPACVAF